MPDPNPIALWWAPLCDCCFVLPFFFCYDLGQAKAIDLVVLNLYPFEATVAKGSGFDTCIENIDIGGPSMLRR